jgi:hypothetical protein
MATSVTTSVGSSISFGYSGLNPLILEPMLLSVGRWHFSAFQSLLCVLSGSQVKVFCNFPIRLVLLWDHGPRKLPGSLPVTEFIFLLPFHNKLLTVG